MLTLPPEVPAAVLEKLRDYALSVAEEPYCLIKPFERTDLNDVAKIARRGVIEHSFNKATIVSKLSNRPDLIIFDDLEPPSKAKDA